MTETRGDQGFSSEERMQLFRALPKVDLHRHLEGSLRLNTMVEIARTYGFSMPPATSYLRPLVQVQAQDSLTFRNFLEKFKTLRLFYRSPEIIARLTREAIQDAAADNVVYLELRFTPVALSRDQGFSLADVMDWVCGSARQASREFGITTRLIASVNRHEPVTVAAQVAQLAQERIGMGITGLDMAGNEVEFSADPFVGLFRDARTSGLSVTIHAGEWTGPESVRHAIEKLGADRIGHGVRVLEDPDVVALARERNIPFEVCITSNYQTGSVERLHDHPLPRMLQAGLNALINTDDPSISQITLSHEYWVACDALGISMEVLRGRVMAATQAAFMSKGDRQSLASQIQRKFNQTAS
jgi:adenosine deaminase